MPVAIDGERLDPVALIENVESLGARYGIGRGIHLGDTIIGTKGRVAFEAPAAEILINSHRELEKLTLTGTQARVKEPVDARSTGNSSTRVSSSTPSAATSRRCWRRRSSA